MKTTAHEFPLHIGDWLKGTTLLSPSERGMYLDLLLYQWDSDTPIPDNEAQQMRIARCTNLREWRSAWPKLRDKFEPVDGGFRNRRCEEARERLSLIRAKRAKAGAKGAAHRWQSDGKAMGGHVTRQCPPDPSPLDLDLDKDRPDRDPPASSDSAFCEFWDIYPSKIGMADARRQWQILNPNAELVEAILRAVRVHRTHPRWTANGGRFIPHAANWLSGRRWEDAIETAGLLAGDDRPGAHNFAWADDCKVTHDGECESRMAHAIRTFSDQEAGAAQEPSRVRSADQGDARH